MTDERASAPSAPAGFSWSAWPGRKDERTAADHSGRVLLVVIAAIGAWLLVRLM